MIQDNGLLVGVVRLMYVGCGKWPGKVGFGVVG